MTFYRHKVRHWTSIQLSLAGVTLHCCVPRTYLRVAFRLLLGLLWSQRSTISLVTSLFRVVDTSQSLFKFTRNMCNWMLYFICLGNLTGDIQSSLLPEKSITQLVTIQLHIYCLNIYNMRCFYCTLSFTTEIYKFSFVGSSHED